MKDGRIPNAEGDEGQEEYKPRTRRHSESLQTQGVQGRLWKRWPFFVEPSDWWLMGYLEPGAG